MTLDTTINRVSYSGNDVTTGFSFPYLFFENSDLVVVLRNTSGTETTKILTTDYTVTGAENPAGGTVTMIVAPATGEVLVIYRDAPQTQDLDLVENDPLPAEEVERRLDKLTMLSQRLSDRLGRALILKETDTSSQQKIPLTADRTSKFLAFDSSGDAIAADGTTETPVSAFMATVLDDTTATAARTTLDAAQAINSATEDTSPASGDFFGSYDVSASAQKKVKISSLATLLQTLWTAPTVQTFTSGSGTYTRPTPSPLYLKIKMCGGGGGGGPSGGAGVTIGSAGGATTFGSSFLTANGGAAGTIPPGGAAGTAAGGTATGGDINITGGTGEGKPAGAASTVNGGIGGSSMLGFGGPPGIATEAGYIAKGYGGGGGGASNNADSTGGGGGGAGGYLEKIVTSPIATSFSYGVGAAGGGGTAGTNGAVGGAGTAGIIIVEEFYQ